MKDGKGEVNVGFEVQLRERIAGKAKEWEFAAKTKKMAPKQRLEARKAFKKKAEGRFKEFKQRFPVARGLKDLRTIQQLTRKLEGVRMAD